MKKRSLQLFYFLLLASVALTACQKTDNHDKPPAESHNSPEIGQHPTDKALSVSPKQVNTIQTPITILALGDSLTEGLGLPAQEAYPAQLEQALKQTGYIHAKVVNSGLSGETSTGLVNRLDWALQTKPDIAILTIGANDAMRGINVPTIEKNLRTAIERLQGEGSIVILGGMQIYDNLGDEYVKSFSAIYPKLAKEYDVAFIPFFLEGVAGDATLNQSDAIHPTKEGYAKIIKQNILPVLEPVLGEFVASDASNKSDNNQLKNNSK